MDRQSNTKLSCVKRVAMSVALGTTIFLCTLHPVWLCGHPCGCWLSIRDTGSADQSHGRFFFKV
ncbi:Uncharacterised protein [Bordetella pertussis]|nr:Uncharacterised protein [Bordetella pertussis]